MSRDTTPVFGGGVPTSPDVDKLIAQLGIPKVGDTIRYDTIVQIINTPRHSSRFHSVVTAWRKRLDRQHNLRLRAVTNTGYEVLNNRQRIGESTSQYKGGLKRIRVAADIAVRTDTDGLRPEEVRARDHIMKTGATLQLAAQTAARQLRYPSNETSPRS